MKTQYIVALSVVAGIAIGVAATQTLRAQAKLPGEKSATNTPSPESTRLKASHRSNCQNNTSDEAALLGGLIF
jgi:hypothetical protein